MPGSSLIGHLIFKDENGDVWKNKEKEYILGTLFSLETNLSDVKKTLEIFSQWTFQVNKKGFKKYIYIYSIKKNSAILWSSWHREGHNS